MKKIIFFAFLTLLASLLAGCSLLSYFNDEEIPSEQGAQNVEVQSTQDPAPSSLGEASTDNAESQDGSEGADTQDHPEQTDSDPADLGEASPDTIAPETELEDPFHTDAGVYQGQIDSNFIEIALLGVPKEEATRVFMLSADIKQDFGGMEPDYGAVIEFQYFTNENGQNVIVKFEETE